MSQAIETEMKRINFLVDRDGYEEAKNFALRTLRMYRTMVLDEKTRVTQRAMIQSYLVLKRFYFSMSRFYISQER